MLSEAINAFLDAEAFLRAVLMPVSSNITVALASAIEQAFPCLIWDAQRRAIAIFFIFELAKLIASTVQFGSNQSRVCSDISSGPISEHTKVRS